MTRTGGKGPVIAAWAVGLAVILVVAVAVFATGHDHRQPARDVAGATPASRFDVVGYGADPSGRADSTKAIRSALAAAESAPGNTVYFPPGTYLLDHADGAADDFIVHAPVHILGAGAATTKIIEEIGLETVGVPRSKVIFEILSTFHGQAGAADGTTISGLTLDSATYDAGTPVLDYASHTTISDLVVVAARSRDHYNPNSFGVRVIAICNPREKSGIYQVSNTVDNVTITGEGFTGTTELDVSCQYNTSVSNINVTGNGMDIYKSHNVSVLNAVFTPGTVEPQPHTWIIDGSTNVTLHNIQTSGSGGVIVPSKRGDPSSDITISEERMTNLSDSLKIGDANRVTIVDSILGLIRLNPYARLDGVSVRNSRIGSVSCPDAALATRLQGLACP